MDILKNAGGYISGERISETLGVTRAAVWKHIKNLRSDGYVIESVTNKGYRLVLTPDKLSAYEITRGLGTEFIGQRLFLYDETDTTNERAKASCSAPDGSVFIAEAQTAGKGTRGRGWSSAKGTGIYHSILLKPDIPPLEAAQITLAAGLAVRKAVELGSMIKWPNDIVIGGKKICGILTEMSTEKTMINFIVCGIGVNVNTESFPAEIAHRATSMYLESGQRFDRNGLLAKILNNFEYYYMKFLDGGLAAILDEYKKYCVTLGRAVNVSFRDKTVDGKAVDVDETGALVVETGEGVIHVSSGEVSVRGIYGYV